MHRAYFAAGAQVATTASYQASLDGFAGAGLRRTDAAALISRSVLIARAVRDEFAADGVQRLVAASIGPYGAALADGSEYRGRYGVSAERLRAFHRPRLELLAAAGADLLAVETIPDVDEAEVLVDLLDEIELPAWFSFSASGVRTRADQPLADAFRVAGSARSVIAVGVNCCPPEDVLPAVQLAVEVTGGRRSGTPIVVRPGTRTRVSGRAPATSTRGWRRPGSRRAPRTSAGAAASARPTSPRWPGRCAADRPTCRPQSERVTISVTSASLRSTGLPRMLLARCAAATTSGMSASASP